MDDEIKKEALKSFLQSISIWMEIKRLAFIIIFTIENSDDDLRKIRKTEDYDRLRALLGIAKNESSN